MTDTGYVDNQQEMLQLLQKVHRDHPRAWCFDCRGVEVPTGPECVRLVPKAEAKGLWGDPLPDDERLFEYAHGITCPQCGSDLGQAKAIYGPRLTFPDGPDGWRGKPVKHETPLPELVLYAD